MSETRPVRVARFDDLTESRGTTVDADGTKIALFRLQDEVLAIDNRCPHRGGPLADGDVSGTTVFCPWHGWCWDLRTGVNVHQPRMTVATYPVTISDGDVFVMVPAASAG